MSTPLQPVNLSVAAFAAGQTGQLFDLTSCAPTANPRFINQNSTLVLYNESGVGLRLTGRDSGLAADLPAGGWLPLLLPVTETAINYMVLYTIVAPTNTLLATYFLPNEQVTIAGLGNGPLNGGTLSSVTSIVNFGQPDPTAVVTASPQSSLVLGLGNTRAIIDNDGSVAMGGNPDAPHDTGQYVLFDNAGNITAASIAPNTHLPSFATFLKSNNPVALLAGNQETGYTALANNNGVTAGLNPNIVGVNPKMVWHAAPSSITFTADATTNVNTPFASDLTANGFGTAATQPANGFTRWLGTWVTVGL